jgi:hypothetical protein
VVAQRHSDAHGVVGEPPGLVEPAGSDECRPGVAEQPAHDSTRRIRPQTGRRCHDGVASLVDARLPHEQDEQPCDR